MLEIRNELIISISMYVNTIPTFVNILIMMIVVYNNTSMKNIFKKCIGM